MSIHFICERCRHPMDLPDQLSGVHGTCKHCGHHLIVPAAQTDAEDGTMRLRDTEEEPPRLPGHLLAPETPLIVRPAEAPPRRKPDAVSDPDEDVTHARRGDEEYTLPRTGGVPHHHSSAGPPPLWVNLPTLTARFLAHNLRSVRNWLYVASIGALVVVLLGSLSQSRVTMHFGAALVIALNISMLVVGLAYLVTLPFQESLWLGLANLLVPFYAIYYWVTRWPKMKGPVLKTLNSFVPILLVGIAYAVYEEAPVVKKEFETEFPVVEKEIDKRLPGVEKRLDSALEPVQESVDRALRPGEGAEPKDGKPAGKDER